ncbi:hypothetical protein [Actinomadura bangladeshensis]|uniref:Uncharacterized protein n=1 Tax=Actinomadura bangladeshensis TaxID=453573 RepID=A0A4R4NNI3_9ACTN|nr:hypothetical protein [Actinomadura bangladeshensis]TDC09400.1 hypothetical protein E1284_29635 [Actinomadura bangladeshensis]
MSGHDLREWTTAQFRSAMTAAMRADPHALDRLARANAALDPHSAAFLRTARMLTLATSAALTTVLTVHRPGRDRRERLVCAACGVGHCQTLRAISDALAAYGLQSDPVDRAEAWRRADAWYARTASRPVPLSIEAFDEGFIARSAEEAFDGVLVVDRHTGALTQWPPLATDALASQYRHYLRGTL